MVSCNLAIRSSALGIAYAGAGCGIAGTRFTAGLRTGAGAGLAACSSAFAAHTQRQHIFATGRSVRSYDHAYEHPHRQQS